MKLLFEAITKFLLGVLLVGCLLFIPAGSFGYYNAWLFMHILFIPMFVVGIIMVYKNPLLLRERLNARERENDQKEVLLFSGIMFILGFIIAGLNYRYRIFFMNNIVVIISSIIFIVSYCLYGIVLKENSYLYRTIKVSENQKLVDSGFYRVVRHPMYSITIVMFLMIPLILNSIISFVIFMIYPFIIVKRINNEEKVLLNELKGYKEYTKKVKYKLIPFIW